MIIINLKSRIITRERGFLVAHVTACLADASSASFYWCYNRKFLNIFSSSWFLLTLFFYKVGNFCDGSWLFVLCLLHSLKMWPQTGQVLYPSLTASLPLRKTNSWSPAVLSSCCIAAGISVRRPLKNSLPPGNTCINKLFVIVTKSKFIVDKCRTQFPQTSRPSLLFQSRYT